MFILKLKKINYLAFQWSSSHVDIVLKICMYYLSAIRRGKQEWTIQWHWQH